MKILEIFDNPGDWVIENDARDDFKASFSVDDIDFTLVIRPQPNDNSIVVVNFFTLDENNNKFIGLLNKGSVFSMQVYSIVADILDYYTTKYDPDVLHFKAKEPSRIKLYDRVVSRLMSNVYDVDTKIYPSGKIYILRKIRS